MTAIADTLVDLYCKVRHVLLGLGSAFNCVRFERQSNFSAPPLLDACRVRQWRKPNRYLWYGPTAQRAVDRSSSLHHRNRRKGSLLGID